MSIHPIPGNGLTANKAARPFWAQLLIFILIEAVHYALFMLASGLVFGSLGQALYSIFGPDAGSAWISRLSVGTSLALCLLRLTLHWLVTFEKRGKFCWTALPMWLWYLGMQLIGAGMHPMLAKPGLFIPTDNLYVYPVVDAVLFLLNFAALAVMVYSLRQGRRPMAYAMLAVQLALMLCIAWMTTCNITVQMAMTIQSGYAASEAAMAPVNTLSNVLYFLQALGMFFIMKKWVFPAENVTP